MPAIESRIVPGRILQVINRGDTYKKLGRLNLCDDGQALQVARISEDRGRSFPAHVHHPVDRMTRGTQECWIVVRGKVEVRCYDFNHELLERTYLESGDCVVSLAGGHGYSILEDDTLVYEIKNGPYFGREADKEWIG